MDCRICPSCKDLVNHVVVQSLSHVQLCSMQDPAAGQTSLFTASSNFKMQWCTGMHTEVFFFLM